jgi:hypothetical protein
VIFCPKGQVGFGIQDLEVKNMALIGKWISSFLLKLRRKYVGSCALSQGFWKPRDSHLWAGLTVMMKNFLFPYGIFFIRDGLEIWLWEDKWLVNATL